MRFVSRLSLIFLTSAALISGCASRGTSSGGGGGEVTSGVNIQLVEERPQSGDSLSVQLSGVRPRSTVDVYLNDDAGREWSYARLRADAKGRVPPTLFWYQSGVIGTTARTIRFKPDPAFITFDEADQYWAKHALKLTVRDDAKRIVPSPASKLGPRTRPMLYPSNAAGVLENAVNTIDEDLYV